MGRLRETNWAVAGSVAWLALGAGVTGCGSGIGPAGGGAAAGSGAVGASGGAATGGATQTGGAANAHCVNSRDCPTPLVCSDLGLCVQCKANADCTLTQSCIGNACRNPCQSDHDCLPDGLLCDSTLGFCVECLGSQDCSAGLVCAAGRCTTPLGGSGGSGGVGGAGGNGGGTTTGGSTADGGASGASSVGGATAGGATVGGSGDTGGSTNPAGGSDVGGSANPAGGSNIGGSANPTGGSNTGGASVLGGGPSAGGSAATGGSGTGGSIPTSCGNAQLDPGEGCDDGNHDLGDGCTPLCTKEPNCSSGPCQSTCGDGLVLGSEQCDDGNTSNGDGCSSDCLVESGFDCSQPALGDTITVPLVARDFNANGKDFEVAITGSSAAVPGIVQTTLVDNKPAFSGTNTQQKTLSDFGTLFADWYRDTSRNAAVVGTLKLYANGKGGYVNRPGPNGEQLIAYTNASFCYDTACSDCTPTYVPGPDTACLNGCTPWGTGNTQNCWVDVVRYDGTPTFFPVDGKGLAPGCTGTSSAVANTTAPCSRAQIPPDYGGTAWPYETSGAYHNFSFTTEIRYWFYYDAGQAYQLDFQGDDDVWVFVNRQLAVDLGGIHTPVAGSFQLPRDASKFNLTSGNVYEIAIFQAERQTYGSTFKLTLSGFNLAPSRCTHQ
jgi:fibro-slime domain-containing protein